jgi:regulator of cell morphogenesis and NO signaling
LRKEEEMLFPLIRTLSSATSRPSFACDSIRTPIAVMEAEHRVVGGLLARLRDLTNGYQAPADTCASTQALMMGLTQLEADTHLHVHKENNHLFPLVTALEEGVCTSAASLHRVGASQKQELPGALVLPLRSLADGWPGPTDSLAA